MWVRVGTDPPRPESQAVVGFRQRLPGVAESGGGCLASAKPRVSGGPVRSSRSAKQLGSSRAFELSLRARRGPVCAAAVELVGPGGVVDARGGIAALRGAPQRVTLRRSRRLRRGLYRLRIDAAALGGVRGAVPSTVLFRLR